MQFNKNRFFEAFKAWLPFAATIVVMAGLVYVVVQQNYRLSANDPQIQIAEDIVYAINHGQPANSILPPSGTTEMSSTLSPFVMIYNDSGKLIGSSTVLDGKDPEFPSGIFDYVKKHGEDKITWQPKPGVRMATVVDRYSSTESGFVVVGRSLTEVEKRISQLTILTALGTAACLIFTFLVILFLTKTSPPETEGFTEVEIDFPDQTI